MKKPYFRYSIWDKDKNQNVINPDTKKAYFFEYPTQAFKLIDNKFNNSPNFCIWDHKYKGCVPKGGFNRK